MDNNSSSSRYKNCNIPAGCPTTDCLWRRQVSNSFFLSFFASTAKSTSRTCLNSANCDMSTVPMVWSWALFVTLNHEEKWKIITNHIGSGSTLEENENMANTGEVIKVCWMNTKQTLSCVESLYIEQEWVRSLTVDRHEKSNSIHNGSGSIQSGIEKIVNTERV